MNQICFSLLSREQKCLLALSKSNLPQPPVSIYFRIPYSTENLVLSEYLDTIQE